MNITKSQQSRLNTLQTQQKYANVLKTLDTDVFEKFEVKSMDTKLDGQTGSDWIKVSVIVQREGYKNESSLFRLITEKRWLIFISPRGKMFAPTYPDFLEGKKKIRNITLGNIVW